MFVPKARHTARIPGSETSNLAIRMVDFGGRTKLVCLWFRQTVISLQRTRKKIFEATIIVEYYKFDVVKDTMGILSRHILREFLKERN